MAAVRSCPVLLACFARRDWSIAPGPGSIREFLLWHDGRLRRYAPTAFNRLLEHLEVIATTEAPAVTVELPLLLAILVWAAPAYPDFGGYERRLFRLIREGRLVDIHIAAELSRPWRQYANARTGELSPVANPLDVLRLLRQDPRECLAQLGDMLQRLLLWRDRRHAGHHAAERLYGTDIETVALAVAYAVRWKGACIDQPRLLKNLQQLHKGQHGLEEGLAQGLVQGHLHAWRQLRTDSRVHPYYTMQAGKRLGAEWPPIQSFTTKGGEYSTAGLVVPPAEHVLVGIDVEQAEFLTVGIVWRLRYPDDPRCSSYLDDVLIGLRREGPDIHQRVGRMFVTREQADARKAREIGKLLNSALVNGATDRGIGELLRQQLQGYRAARSTANLIADRLSVYPVERWRYDLGQFSAGHGVSAVDLPDGRRMPASDGPQFASRLTQTFFSDAFHFACYELIRCGFCPSVIAYDEVAVEVFRDDDPAEVHSAFLSGFAEVFGDVPVGARLEVYPERWKNC